MLFRSLIHIIKLIFSEDVDENRLKRLIENTSGFHSEEVKKDIADVKSKLNADLSKQEKLSGLFSENLLAMEAYKKQIIPLREEEEELKSRIKKMELRLIERERSKEYIKLLETVANHFEDLKTQTNLSGKKWLLKLVFKSIRIDNGKIKKIELYEPFKGLYEGVKIKCQLQEIQGVPAIEGSVSTLLPTDVK